MSNKISNELASFVILYKLAEKIVGLGKLNEGYATRLEKNTENKKNFIENAEKFTNEFKKEYEPIKEKINTTSKKFKELHKPKSFFQKIFPFGKDKKEKPLLEIKENLVDLKYKLSNYGLLKGDKPLNSYIEESIQRIKDFATVYSANQKAEKHGELLENFLKSSAILIKKYSSDCINEIYGLLAYLSNRNVDGNVAVKKYEETNEVSDNLEKKIENQKIETKEENQTLDYEKNYQALISESKRGKNEIKTLREIVKDFENQGKIIKNSTIETLVEEEKRWIRLREEYEKKFENELRKCRDPRYPKYKIYLDAKECAKKIVNFAKNEKDLEKLLVYIKTQIPYKTPDAIYFKIEYLYGNLRDIADS